MEISVIIPSFNGLAKLPGLLSCLMKQSVRNFEVWVIVDGSTDETEEYLSSLEFENTFNLNYKVQPNRGRSATRNQGARLAKGKLLLFLDDDMEPDAHCLGAHLAHHQKFTGSVLVGNQMEDSSILKTDVQRYKAFLSRKWLNQLHTDASGRLVQPFITAAHFSISKELFQRIGGFDESLTDAEDRELAARCVQDNIPIHFDKKINAWHNDLITARSYSKRLHEYEKANSQLQLLHPEFFTSKEKRFSSLQKIAYAFFGQSIWIWMIDHFNVFMVLPLKLRYLVYDWVFTGSSYLKSR